MTRVLTLFPGRVRFSFKTANIASVVASDSEDDEAPLAKKRKAAAAAGPLADEAPGARTQAAPAPPRRGTRASALRGAIDG